MSAIKDVADEVTLTADDVIQECLNLETPRSFFLYAGAGSGKTHSLVVAVKSLKERERQRLTFEGRQIAIITYTNAACEEIARRLEHDPLVEVSTIHAFSWKMIKGFNDDIREWLRIKLASDIAELDDRLGRARSVNKTSQANQSSRDSKARRLAVLDEIPEFTYSPTGDNVSRQSLNHSEVIQMAAAFLPQPPLLDVMADRHPVLLIDESQDTNGALMDAFLKAQAAIPGRFCLGLLGDTMQRIYNDGKLGLDEAIPSDWAKPEKRINRRCPIRVVKLINDIRAGADDHLQIPKQDAAQGAVRMFCTRQAPGQDFSLEDQIAEQMEEITGDAQWSTGKDGRKTLILEHKMAARRMGFEGVFAPLYAVAHLNTALMDGTLPILKVFFDGVAPIVAAASSDDFTLMEAVRLRSPLLDPKYLEAAGNNQFELLESVGVATHALCEMLRDNNPLIEEVAQLLQSSGLLALPDRLVAAMDQGATADPAPETSDREALEIHAYRVVLGRRYSEMAAFAGYANGLSPYGTHQGVKGLEFPRVMVILNDEEAGGFLFSYEKLLGVTPASATDMKNESEGKDTSLSRTRRLLYVTCSRAEESLAIVVYSAQPEVARERVIDAGWLTAEEVVVL
ncbi:MULTISPECIES: UvrD-helicase domain-containing protein [Pseudomonas]|uniref:UvrD-helicase domain-containing protein n=1 Tax=Pseudomonas TaxID=286 RepID=UPI000B35A682|nr:MULTISPECIES: UvrD-helicase domain-containing protein [Pseudomonas]PMY61679.1 DNA helicase II [Pseudomonas sp. FW305-25]PMY63541.1 DNA helicase II [Pseudomonas sp. FW126-L8]PNA75017.1 DNA helicase II [Pseudomonas sp. FW305-76]